jgi:hypothetical protein
MYSQFNNQQNILVDPVSIAFQKGYKFTNDKLFRIFMDLPIAELSPITPLYINKLMKKHNHPVDCNAMNIVE